MTSSAASIFDRLKAMIPDIWCHLALGNSNPFPFHAAFGARVDRCFPRRKYLRINTVAIIFVFGSDSVYNMDSDFSTDVFQNFDLWFKTSSDQVITVINNLWNEYSGICLKRTSTVQKKSVRFIEVSAL